MTPVPEVLVVGDGPVAEALVPMLGTLGWPSHTATTLPEVERALPSCDAVVVLSHHDAVDAPALAAALRAGTAYVGAMGSRRTRTRRREWLLGDGVGEDAQAALHTPIGLDIGADEPGEIAVSILAELVAEHRGRTTGITSLAGREGPIHPDRAPGEATCPEG